MLAATVLLLRNFLNVCCMAQHSSRNNAATPTTKINENGITLNLICPINLGTLEWNHSSNIIIENCERSAAQVCWTSLFISARLVAKKRIFPNRKREEMFRERKILFRSGCKLLRHGMWKWHVYGRRTNINLIFMHFRRNGRFLFCIAFAMIWWWWYDTIKLTDLVANATSGVRSNAIR